MQLDCLIRCALLCTASLLAGCSNLLFGVANAPTYFDSRLRAHDVSFGSDSRQKLDIYAPENPHALPVVIFWHGGSWAEGDKANYRFVGAALAQHGLIAVLANYRLHPAIKFPAFMDDAAAAVAWVQAHAHEYGGDPERIVLMGHSAGAHIATLLAYDPRFLRAARGRAAGIRGVVGLSGPYALDPDSTLLRTIFATPYALEDWRPVLFANHSAPPTLIVHGTSDGVVSIGHAQKLRSALQAADVPVQMETFSGANHADTVASFAWLRRSRWPVLERTVQFIQSVTERQVALRDAEH